MDSNHVQSDLRNVLYTKEQIQLRITELAAEIDEDYAGRDVLLVGVLKGAVMMMADGRPGPRAPESRHHGLDGRRILRLGNATLRCSSDP